MKPPGSEPERTGQALDDDEIAATVAAAEKVGESPAAMVWLMARAGLCVGEAAALHRSDIDLAAGTLTVRLSMNRRGDIVAPKGRKRADQVRTVPMPADLTERLQRHLTASTVASTDGLVFTAPHGGPVRYPNRRTRVWEPATEAAGVDANP